MKKLMLCLFLGLLFVASPVSSGTPDKPTYNKGYLLRNAVVWKLYVWKHDWTLIGTLDASKGVLKIPDDGYPLILAGCAEPGKGGSDCGVQFQIKDPGCWVIWWWPWGHYYYETVWACSVGSKAAPSPAKAPPPKTAIKQPLQKNVPAPHK